MDIEFFTNDRFKILSCMQQRQIDILGNQYVPLSQRQIAKITGIAYKTVNSIIKALCDNEYIIRQGTTRGQYSLTNKAISVLTTMQNGGAKK
ncbi:MAG: winged helix-turn-helix transcriptional regulator [Prevotella sp.]|jgi:predicted transcriptional regulator|nr:winged helix-turn-helix transcriptional regulator [Prevotella sp.]